MVERVARAIWNNGYPAEDDYTWERAKELAETGRDVGYRAVMDHARASIEVMREPTAEMLASGVLMTGDPFNVDDVWRAMIDEATLERAHA